ncbi:MAG: hypothetical protein M3Z36_09750 [Acidobacteriota bacterium]|nr:hypothetical protein [Acidobacteriota bacterium]
MRISRGVFGGGAGYGGVGDLARGRLRNKLDDLQLALEGNVTGHHRFLLKEYLEQVEYLDRKMARFEHRIEEHMSPLEDAVTLWITIPGVESRGGLEPGGGDRSEYGGGSRRPSIWPVELAFVPATTKARVRG